MLKKNGGKKPHFDDNFGNWLYFNIDKVGKSRSEIADYLHISLHSLSDHITGEANPTFSHVIAYCWYFNKFRKPKFDYDPEVIWELAEKRKSLKLKENKR